MCVIIVWINHAFDPNLYIWDEQSMNNDYVANQLILIVFDDKVTCILSLNVT